MKPDIKICSQVMQLRPFIKDKNFSTDEILAMIQRTCETYWPDMRKELDELRAVNSELIESLEAAIKKAKGIKL